MGRVYFIKMTTAASLTLETLSKHYGDTPVVDELSLSLPRGKLLTLLGPSGCGKTTTLKLIAGLLEPDGGDVLFNGASVLGLPPEKRGLGMVFQQPTLFPHLTVGGNVGFGLGLRGVRGGELKRRIGAALGAVALDGFEHRFPAQLSGGQQQRVALARTLVTEPRVLLLDEPLSSLDANLRDELRETIRELQTRLEITTVFVTHEQKVALALSDVVGVMFGGRLEQIGSPQEIYERPKTPAVARFMGAANFISGRLEEHASGPVFRYTAGCLRLCTGGETGKPLVVTIRPEHIGLEPVEPDFQAATEPNQLVGLVTKTTYQGETVRYIVQACDLTLTVHGIRQLASPGTSVRLTLPAEHLVVFPEPDPPSLKPATQGVL